MRGHRSDDHDEVRGADDQEIRIENHRVAQRSDGRRHGDVRSLPRERGRADPFHLCRRTRVRRPRSRFRRSDAPPGDVPHAGTARGSDCGRTRSGTPM